MSSEGEGLNAPDKALARRAKWSPTSERPEGVSKGGQPVDAASAVDEVGTVRDDGLKVREL